MIMIVMCKNLSALTLSALLAFGLTSCGIGQSEDGKLDVVAGFYPMAYISEQIGENSVEVSDLTRPNTEPHDLEITPRQRTRIADADLAVYLKGFQPAFDAAIANHNKDRGFNAAEVEPLLDGYVPVEESGGKPEGGHGKLHDDGQGKDPHIWLNPIRLANVVAALAKRLSQIDPSEALKFNRAAAQLRGKLQALDTEISDALHDCASRTIVTSHNAFGYFAERYKLKQIAINGLSPEQEPSPERLAEVSRIAQANHVNTVFFENLVSPKLSETLAREIGAKTAKLDPLESKPEHGDYFSQMRANVQALRTALQCS